MAGKMVLESWGRVVRGAVIISEHFYVSISQVPGAQK